MIKTNDLRLNNLVKWNDSVQKITAIAFGNCLLDKNPTADYPVKITEIEPIYLTEEWLLKAGFERVFTNDFWYQIRIGDKRLLVSTLGGNVEIEKWDRTMINFSSICEYVHQLQNLYFALHYEELVFSTEP